MEAARHKVGVERTRPTVSHTRSLENEADTAPRREPAGSEEHPRRTSKQNSAQWGRVQMLAGLPGFSIFIFQVGSVCEVKTITQNAGTGIQTSDSAMVMG